VSFSHGGCQNKSFVIRPSHCQIVSNAPSPLRRWPRVMTITALSTATYPARNQARVLWVACGAHALHDGFTDTLYVLLPLWQAQFALSYAAIGILRALYAGVMAGLQVPVAGATQRIGGARILAAGTAAAAAAYFFLGASSSVAMLATALVLGGIGSSTQHPIASSLVAAAYEGPRSRGALGTYNFAGDLGKMALPSLTAGLIAVMSWHSAASIIGVIGLVGATVILLLLRSNPMEGAVRVPANPHEAGEARDAAASSITAFLFCWRSVSSTAPHEWVS
jgi:MFS transporter, FSR family, fosmidomycin resistance protein